MEISNIRVIIPGRNEYCGSISMDEEGNLYGIGTEKNYDSNVNFLGHCGIEGMYLFIVTENGNIPIMAKSTDYFPKKVIATSRYFGGYSLDIINDTVFISITSMHEVEKSLSNEKPNVLSLKIRTKGHE